MRVVCRWLVLLCAACATPAPAPASAPAAPRPVYTPLAIAPPALPAARPVQRLCARAQAAAAPVKPSRTYDFTPIEVTRGGPTLETSPLDGARRDGEAIRGAVIALRPALVQCIGSARARGFHGEPTIAAGQSASLQVRFTIDPFGAASEIAVDGPAPLACIRDVLAQLAVTRPTPRRTRVAMPLTFLHLEAVAARPAPAPATTRSRAGCMFARDPLPVDELAVDRLTFDLARPHHPRRNCRHRTVDKAMIRRAVVGNLGALRSCYAAATARQPGLTGIVDTTFVLAASDGPSQIVVGGAGDAALHACVAGVLEATVVGAWTVPTLVHLPLDLTAGSDDASAVAAYAAAARARDVGSECSARIAAIAGSTQRPRQPDARAFAAIAALDRFLDARGRPASCIEQARPLLVANATWPMTDRAGADYRDLRYWRGGGLAEAVERTRGLLREFPELRADLLPFVVDASLVRFRTRAALADALAYFALPVTTPEGRRRVAEAYAAGVAQRDGVLPFDDCESNAPY